MSKGGDHKGERGPSYKRVITPQQSRESKAADLETKTGGFFVLAQKWAAANAARALSCQMIFAGDLLTRSQTEGDRCWAKRLTRQGARLSNGQGGHSENA